jgi:hypothetical protein
MVYKGESSLTYVIQFSIIRKNIIFQKKTLCRVRSIPIGYYPSIRKINDDFIFCLLTKKYHQIAWNFGNFVNKQYFCHEKFILKPSCEGIHFAEFTIHCKQHWILTIFFVFILIRWSIENLLLVDCYLKNLKKKINLWHAIFLVSPKYTLWEWKIVFVVTPRSLVSDISSQNSEWAIVRYWPFMPKL